MISHNDRYATQTQLLEPEVKDVSLHLHLYFSTRPKEIRASSLLVGPIKNKMCQFVAKPTNHYVSMHIEMETRLVNSLFLICLFGLSMQSSLLGHL